MLNSSHGEHVEKDKGSLEGGEPGKIKNHCEHNAKLALCLFIEILNPVWE